MIRKDAPCEGDVFEKVGGKGKSWMIERLLEMGTMPRRVDLRHN